VHDFADCALAPKMSTFIASAPCCVTSLYDFAILTREPGNFIGNLK